MFSSKLKKCIIKRKKYDPLFSSFRMSNYKQKLFNILPILLFFGIKAYKIDLRSFDES